MFSWNYIGWILSTNISWKRNITICYLRMYLEMFNRLDFTSFYICKSNLEISDTVEENQSVCSLENWGWGWAKGPKVKVDNILCVGSPHRDTVGLKNKYAWIRLQTGVEWLFLAGFKVSKEPKRPDMSSCIVRDPQNSLISHKKNLLGGINIVYKAVSSFIDCTSCTCQASTK